jgi:hypothetical protein
MKRLSFLLPIVVLFAAVTSTRAQVIFSATAGNPQARVGGMAEGAGDVTLVSNGATFPAGVGNAVVTLTYSTTITNKALTSVSPVTCPVGPSASIAVPSVAPVGITVTINNITCISAGITINWGVAGNTLTLQFNTGTSGSIAFVNSTVNTTITIHGVRLNAAALGIPPTLPTISTFLNTSPPANLQLWSGSTSLTVGTLATMLGSVTRLSGSTNTNDAFYSLGKIQVTNTFGAPTMPGNTCGATACNVSIYIVPKSSYTNCGFRAIPQGASAGGTVIITGDEPTIDRNGANNFGGNGGANAIGIKIVEGYPGALTSKTDEAIKSNAAEVDNGTRVRVDFSGLPTQVVVAAPIRVLSANAYYTMAVSGLSMDLVGNTQCAIGACGVPQTALADIRAASGGAVTFEYEVTANTGGVSGIPSGIVIPFFSWRTSTPVDLSTINISVRLSPILGSSVPRFSDQLPALTSTVAISACTSRLFFPFVTNMGGFDTGIYMANVGQSDQRNTDESGTCTARFFDGSTTGTTPVKASTTPTLGPGQSFSFTASDATLGKPGFQGYVTVSCAFEYAYGLAYVVAGYGSVSAGTAPPGTAYLAINSYYSTVP